MTTVREIVPRTPLHSWIAERMGIPSEQLTREAITSYQLQKLRRCIRRAHEYSAFYSSHLQSVNPMQIESLHDLASIPFTTPQHVAHNASRMLCVSQDEISRVVTNATSGTSGVPKRLFFSTADQESTLDFFAHGVSTLASAGDRMLVALPGERVGSVGEMLAQGIQRFGVQAVRYGLISDPQHALETMDREGATSIIGFPVQMILLAAQRGGLADRVFSRLNSIVLCSDYVSPSILCRLRERAGCGVFQHYGMTETGLGGGVDCKAHTGYHLRETDLLFEIVDPKTGEPVPDGSSGEVVLSTLTRDAMPLIRYRTGDISSFSAEQCPCGSCVRVLRYLRTRIEGQVAIGDCGEICIADLDDALFALPEVVDTACTLTLGEIPELEVVLKSGDHVGDGLIQRAMIELEKIQTLRTALTARKLRLQITATCEAPRFTGSKRRLEVRTL